MIAIAAFLDQTLIHAQRQILKTSRSPFVIMQGLVFPVFLLFAFHTAYGKTLRESGSDDPITGLVGMTLMVSSMFGGLVSGMALMRERNQGLLTRFYSLPPHQSSIIFGRLLADVVVTLVAALTLAGWAHAIGFRFHAGWTGFIGFLGVAGLVGIGMGAMILALALTSRARQGVVVLSPVFTLMMFFNTGFMPLSSFPDILQPVVEHLPVSVVVQSVRGFVDESEPLTGPLLQTLAWFGGGAVVFSLYAMRAFRRAVTGDR